MINEDRLIRQFIKLVETGSPSKQEGPVRDLLRKAFENRGLTVHEDQAGQQISGNAGNLLVRIPGSIHKPALLFSAHMDTVQPGTGVKARVDVDGYIRSQGATILGSDDKAGIAAMLEAYDVLKERGIPHPPFEFLFTVCEEQGLLGIKHFHLETLQARWGYVLDAGNQPGSIVIRSPAINVFEYIVRGKSAHAGMNPETGVNAIQAAGAALAKMPNGRIDAETTCSVGLIRGGTARNIVPDYCLINGEARSLSRFGLQTITEQLAGIFKQEVESFGAQAEVLIEQLYPEICLDPHCEAVAMAIQAIKSIGLTPELVSTGGGSDASIINSVIPCVNLGVGMEQVHTCDECIAISSLVQVTRIILAIIKQAAGS